MFDETAKIRKSSRSVESLQEQLRQLDQHIHNTINLVSARRELLRPHGVGLPLGSLQTLRQMRHDLKQMETRITSAQSELRQLRGLADTAALITSSLDLNDVLNGTMDRVIELTGAERGYIVLINEATGALEFKVARGIDRADLQADAFIISNTVVERVATSGETILTHNAQDDPRFMNSSDSIVGYELRSILAVPLCTPTQTIGVVYCDNRVRPNLFNEHEQSLLQAFANQAAVAIQNARLFENVNARLAEMREVRDLMDNVFKSIVSGLITLSRDNRITAYNAAAESIIGVAAAEALGQSLDRVLPLLDDEFRAKLDSARELEPQDKIELDLTFADPQPRYWKVRLSALRDVDGVSGGVALVLDDLTAEKAEEERLRAARVYLPEALVNQLRSLDITQVGGEERTITALFADVRGFTSFSESLEPEALMEIINRYLSSASDAIEVQEGVVDKYMGDAVTGLFNTQLNPQADHAQRAVRAALSLVRDIHYLNQHERPADQRPLHYGIGIHTGTAVMGSIGSLDRREFSALGDALDMSKLLQENAGEGEIIVSAATYELVRDSYQFEALTPRKTKGHASFTIMYRLTGWITSSGTIAPILTD